MSENLGEKRTYWKMPGKLFPGAIFELANTKAVFPYRKHEYDAGLDLSALEAVAFKPGETKKVKTGIKVKIPQNYFGLVVPRSSLRLRGFIIQSIIDCGYEGQLDIIVSWLSPDMNKLETIAEGERFCQILIIPVNVTAPRRSHIQAESTRGQGGFGSTG